MIVRLLIYGQVSINVIQLIFKISDLLQQNLWLQNAQINNRGNLAVSISRLVR